jgi:hypothetical protein
MRQGTADLAKVFDQGHSGNYPAPLLDPDQLLELSAMCLRANRIVSNTEGWELVGEYELARFDFLLGGELAGGWASTWPERARQSRAEITKLVELARAERNPIRFEVWLDWSDD